MNELRKRFKSGAWVALAGFISTILVLVVENVEMFQMSDQWKAVTVILATAVISQITKWLNSGNKK